MDKSASKLSAQRVILAVLALISVFIWYNGLRSFSRKKTGGSTFSEYPGVAPVARAKIARKKRSAYEGWGRNPFTAGREDASSPSALALGGIVYDKKDSYVIINDQLLHVGDQVNGSKVIDIGPERVILNDGSKDIELRLEQ